MLRSNAFEPDERVYKEAKSFLKNGYDVTLLCWDREGKFPEEEVYEGIKVERISLKAGYGSLNELLFKMPFFWIKLFFRGLGKEFDVVHAYDYDTLPAGVWLKWFKRKKLVYDALELFLSYTSDKTVNKGMFFIERINLPYINALIYTNEERLKIFKENTNLKDKLIDNTIIIHNYPELGLKSANERNKEEIIENSEANKEEIMGILDTNKDKITFQYNGGIKEDRNLLNILKAFKEINKDLSLKKLTFLIIGNHYNAYGDVLKDYVKENGLEELVEFHDFVPIQELLELLKTTQIGFVPLLKDSLNNLIPEPNKLYNYFATGNLAVVENTPYLKKIVGDSGLGLSCDFSDVQQIKESIEWVLQNPENADKMIIKAYDKYVNEYNWESQEEKLIELYRQL